MVRIIIAQVIGIIGWLLFWRSYHQKNLNKAILYQVFSSLCDCFNYLVLGAFGGCFICVFELIKGLAFYKTDKDKYIFYFTLPIYIIIGFISENSFLVILTIAASIIDGYGSITSQKAVVVTGVISNILWLIYDLSYHDYVVAIADLVIVISNISILVYGFSKFLKRDNIHVISCPYISKVTLAKIVRLDKDIYDHELLWSYDTIKDLYDYEKHSYLLVKDLSEIIGYVNILNITKDTYDNFFTSNTIYDTFDRKSISKFKKDKKIKKEIYLNINSIVVQNAYQNNDSVTKIAHSISRFIKNLAKHNYIVKKFVSVAVNDFEEKVLKEIGATKIKNITNEYFLYEWCDPSLNDSNNQIKQA